VKDQLQAQEKTQSQTLEQLKLQDKELSKTLEQLQAQEKLQIQLHDLMKTKRASSPS
jgi:cell envelope opacity-associated protein A